MAIYKYKCTNNSCTITGKVKEINKPMTESSKIEICPICNAVLQKVFSVGAIKTGDGVKG